MTRSRSTPTADEGYWSFRQAFEDHITFPLAARVVGVPTSVTGVDFDGDERRGLTATVTRDDHTSTISLLDVELDDSETDAIRLVAAYRHWLGITDRASSGRRCTSLGVTEMSDEQRMQRALKRQRARALAAEAEHERAEARRREWAAEGTRLTREELEAGEACRGCGRPIIDGRGSWPALLRLSPDERAEHDAAEADYKARHGECRASRWSMSGSRSIHCSSCCPPPPLSKRQVEELAFLLSEPVDPRELASWWLVLTCDHIIERSQHRTHDRWSSLPVIECPTCGRHRGIVTADRLPARPNGTSAER